MPSRVQPPTQQRGDVRFAADGHEGGQRRVGAKRGAEHDELVDDGAVSAGALVGQGGQSLPGLFAELLFAESLLGHG